LLIFILSLFPSLSMPPPPSSPLPCVTVVSVASRTSNSVVSDVSALFICGLIIHSLSLNMLALRPASGKLDVLPSPLAVMRRVIVKVR
jgi:hypothetical protein